MRPVSGVMPVPEGPLVCEANLVKMVTSARMERWAKREPKDDKVCPKSLLALVYGRVEYPRIM